SNDGSLSNGGSVSGTGTRRNEVLVSSVTARSAEPVIRSSRRVGVARKQRQCREFRVRLSSAGWCVQHRAGKNELGIGADCGPIRGVPAGPFVRDVGGACGRPKVASRNIPQRVAPPYDVAV